MANTNIQTAPQNSETRPTGYRVWRIVTSVTLRNGQFAKNPFPTAMHEMEDDDGFDGDGWFVTNFSRWILQTLMDS